MYRDWPGGLVHGLYAMKIITLIAVLVLLLLEFIGPKSSVGGPITEMFVLCVVVLVVGIYEAWSNKRGVVGWVVNIIAAVFGGLVAFAVIGIGMDEILTRIHFEGRLASSHHPLKYILTIAVAILTVLGAWLPIRLVNLFRRSRAEEAG